MRGASIRGRAVNAKIKTGMNSLARECGLLALKREYYNRKNVF